MYDRFKSNRTLHFCHFFYFFGINEGNSGLAVDRVIKFHYVIDGCESQMRVRVK